MSSICTLRIPNVKSCLEQSQARSACHPISLLAFLQVENRRLQATMAQLERDIMALRERAESSFTGSPYLKRGGT
jgi:type II secretory pathway component PulJ